MSYYPLAPQPKKPRTGLWIAVGGAGLIVFVALVLVGALITTNLAGLVFGRAAATHFSAADATAVMLDSSEGARFGTWVEPDTTTTDVSDAQSQLADNWQNDSPAASALPCEFVYSLYPLTNLETAGQGSQPVALNDEFVTVDSASSVSQSTRVFASTAEATNYIAQLKRLIAGCTSYSTASWSATVAALPLSGVTLNDAAWAETGTGDSAGSSYYAADLQRGNIVTRVIGNSGSSGDGVLNSHFFTEVVKVAEGNLQALRPGSGVPQDVTGA